MKISQKEILVAVIVIIITSYLFLYLFPPFSDLDYIQSAQQTTIKQAFEQQYASSHIFVDRDYPLMVEFEVQDKLNNQNEIKSIIKLRAIMDPVFNHVKDWSLYCYSTNERTDGKQAVENYLETTSCQ